MKLPFFVADAPAVPRAWWKPAPTTFAFSHAAIASLIVFARVVSEMFEVASA